MYGEGMCYQHGECGWDRFLTGVIVIEGKQRPTFALKWLTTYPVWPLKRREIRSPENPDSRTTDQGHIESSMSPWNTVVFVMKKKTGKWQLLHDLRKINAVMESMGAFNQVCHPPQ